MLKDENHEKHTVILMKINTPDSLLWRLDTRETGTAPAQGELWE